MGFGHGAHDSDVVRNIHSLAAEFAEVLHGLALPVRSDDDLHVFGEVLGEPKGNIPLFSIVSICEVVDALKDQYDFVVVDVEVLDGLILDALVADIEPVSEVFPQFLFVQLHLLVDVQLLPQLNQDAVDGVEVVAVVTARRREVQDYQVVIPASSQRLVVLVPLDQKGLLAHTAIGLDNQGAVLLSGEVEIEPLLDHEVILFEAAARLVLVEAEHDV